MPRNDNLCPFCNSWEISQNDDYCGWCGKKFQRFELLVDNELFMYKPEVTEVTVTLQLKNMLPSEFTIHEYTIDDTKNVEIVAPENFSAPYSLAAKQTLEIKLKIDTVSFTEQEKEIELTFFTDFQDKPLTQKIRFAPSPKIALQKFPDTLSFTVDNDEPEISTFEISIYEGCAFLEAPIVEPAWLQAVFEGVEPNDKGYFLDAKYGPEKISCKLVPDKAQLKAEWETHKKNEIPGFLKLSANSQVLINQEFKCNIIVPPILEICLFGDSVGEPVPGEAPVEQVFNFKIDPVPKGTRLHEIILPLFEIKNSGSGTLEITDLQKKSAQPWIKKIELQKTKFEGGSQHEPVPVRATIDLDKLTAGLGEIVIEITSNHRQKPDSITICNIHVDVVEIKTFQGAVALDFGTTNSCCAIFHNGKVQLVPIDKDEKAELLFEIEKIYKIKDKQGVQTGQEFVEKGVTIPTLTLYQEQIQREKDMLRVFSIGGPVHDQLKNGAANRENSLVKNIKERLGLNHKLEIEFSTDNDLNPVSTQLLPEEIVADFLNTVLGRVEYIFRQKIQACYFSHPVGFHHERLAALKDAFKRAGIQDIQSMDMWPEPVCAAFYFIFKDIVPIFEKQTTDEKHEIYLLLFDFGGGTSDLSLFKIAGSKHKKKKTINIQPTLIDMDGHRKFGGENITEAILNEFAEQITRNHPDVFIYKPFVEFHGISDEQLKIGKQNYYKLWTIAEDAKFAISAGDSEFERTSGVLSRNKVDKLIPLAIERKWLIETAKTKMEPLLKIVDDLLARNQAKYPNFKLDYFVLTGNSSRMTFIEDFIKERYPDDNLQIKYPTQWYKQDAAETDYALKECVAIGLCYLAKRQKIVKNVKIGAPKKVAFSTTDLGIPDISARGAETNFRAIVGKGQAFDDWYESEHQFIYEPGNTIEIHEKIAYNDFEKVAEFLIPEFEGWTFQDYENALLEANISEDYVLELRLVIKDDESDETLKSEPLDSVKILM